VVSDTRVGPLVGRVARKAVGRLEPDDPALGPQMKGWRGGPGIVETCAADINEPRIIGRAPGKRRTAVAAEMPHGLRGGMVGEGGTHRHGERVNRDGKPSDDRRAMRPLTHPAMAIEHLDGRTRNTIAYLAAQAAARKNICHSYLHLHQEQAE